MLSKFFGRPARPTTNHSNQQSVPQPALKASKPSPAPVERKDAPAFASLGLADNVLQGALAAGYTEPTPIQARAIPPVLRGGDVLGSAQTGTGKTAAFMLPILSRLGKHQGGNSPRALILEPTRELALQVEENARIYGKFTDLRATAVYGGVGYGKQREDLRRGVDVLVATPGRLQDYIEQRDVRLDKVEILVLDEVDRMLDMGFLPAVKKLVELCPRNRQTLFFSATLPPELEKLSGWALRPNPETIEIGERRSPAETVTHAFYPVNKGQKFNLLAALLEQNTDAGSILVFARTRHGADRIARKLKGLAGAKGGPRASAEAVAVLHSDRSQNQRVAALEGFKSGKFPVMVATDIAARGIDVASVTHVVNFDIPKNPEDYVHRIGRTGRAQREGDAFTLIAPEDADAARAVEKYLGQKVERRHLQNFRYDAPEEAAPAPVQQNRGGGRRNGGAGQKRWR